MSAIESWFGEAAAKILQGINAHTREALVKYIQSAGEMEELDIAFVQVAYGLAPKALTAAGFIQRTPYAQPEAFERLLQQSAGRGWLVAKKPGQYHLSKEGKQVVQGLFEVARGLYARLPAPPGSEITQAVELLGRVNTGIENLNEPGQKANFALGRLFEPQPGAPAWMVLRRRLLDLRAFRDDVHIAAWQPYEPDGRIWEAFTFVWRGEARSAAALAEQLSGYRYYDEKAYANALAELVMRGWIESSNGGFRATPRGSELRQRVEAETDHLFDAPWQVLSGEEIKTLQELLAQLSEVVTPLPVEADEEGN